MLAVLHGAAIRLQQHNARLLLALQVGRQGLCAAAADRVQTGTKYVCRRKPPCLTCTFAIQHQPGAAVSRCRRLQHALLLQPCHMLPQRLSSCLQPVGLAGAELVKLARAWRPLCILCFQAARRACRQGDSKEQLGYKQHGQRRDTVHKPLLKRRPAA